VTYDYHHTCSYYSTYMRLIIITIQVHIIVHMWYLQLSPTRFILQHVYVMYNYHQYSFILQEVLCALQVSKYRFILQYIYGTYNYHRTGSYYSKSMWFTIITNTCTFNINLCDLSLSPYHTGLFYSKSMGLIIITIQVQSGACVFDL
jgi:hypothetical protein